MAQTLGHRRRESTLPQEGAVSRSGDSGLVAAALGLRRAVGRLRFGPPVATVYNPLEYAWPVHREYLERYGAGRKRVVFLGMNPGPFGMAQTGVPFGEVAAVRDWLGLMGKVGCPPDEHPRRRIQGFQCPRSEVSGRRLWALFADTWGTPEAFFRDHFVANYCPLVFMAANGSNLTPDKLRASEVEGLHAACNDHLRALVALLRPEWVVGVGAFAESRAREAFAGGEVNIARMLHPSPASPAANRGWAEQATRQLRECGIWT